MSRIGRLAGAGALAIVGTSFMVLALVPAPGVMDAFYALNLAGLPYLIAAVSLISALALSLYITPEEHLWGSDETSCDRASCRHARH
jgi:hypothetical protein